MVGLFKKQSDQSLDIHHVYFTSKFVCWMTRSNAANWFDTRFMLYSCQNQISECSEKSLRDMLDPSFE